MRHSSILLSVFALTLAFAAPASAKKFGGFTFKDAVTVDDQELMLNGTGMRLATIFGVKVYAAGLYTKTKATSAKELLGRDDAWRLVLKFKRDVGGDDLKKSISEAFEKNKMGKFDKKVAKLTTSFSSVKKGETVRITYIPGKGVRVVSNGKGSGRVSGARFAKALLACWIGPKPPNKELKKGLLGG